MTLGMARGTIPVGITIRGTIVTVGISDGEVATLGMIRGTAVPDGIILPLAVGVPAAPSWQATGHTGASMADADTGGRVPHLGDWQARAAIRLLREEAEA